MIALVAVTLSAWATLALPTINYSRYYAALSQFEFNVSNFTITRDASMVNGSLVFILSNPTPYIGLEFLGVTYQARIPTGNVASGSYGSYGTESLTMGLGSVGFSQAQVLGAHSSYNLPARFSVQGLAVTQFMEVYNASRGMVNWNIEGSYSLQTRDGILDKQFQIPVAETP